MTDESTMKCSVVVITFNRAGDLPRSVRSLYAQTHRPLEIVLVDDASTDSTPEAMSELAEKAPDGVAVIVRRRETNGGIGPARNTGIEAASGDIIAFTDDDCVAEPTWAAELAKGFSSDQIGAVGGAIVEPPERSWAQRAAEGINFLGTKERSVRALNGCNMAYRATFLDAHPFDPKADYGDDLDRCFDVAGNGLVVWFTPRARVVHHHRRSIRAFLRQQFRRGKGSVWVRRKHRSGLWPRKNWVTLLAVLSGIALPVFRNPPALAAFAGAQALFLLMIFLLDAARGKGAADTLSTLPLVAAGYVVELLGGIVGLLAGRPGGRTS